MIAVVPERKEACWTGQRRSPLRKKRIAPSVESSPQLEFRTIGAEEIPDPVQQSPRRNLLRLHRPMGAKRIPQRAEVRHAEGNSTFGVACISFIDRDSRLRRGGAEENRTTPLARKGAASVQVEALRLFFRKWPFREHVVISLVELGPADLYDDEYGKGKECPFASLSHTVHRDAHRAISAARDP